MEIIIKSLSGGKLILEPIGAQEISVTKMWKGMIMDRD
jgi:hypothetical protein